MGLVLKIRDLGLGFINKKSGILDCRPLPKRVCCVTSLGFDHTSILGSTITKIAAAKVGIFRPGAKLISAVQVYPDAIDVLSKEAESVGECLTHANPEIVSGVNLSLSGKCHRENASNALLAAREILGVGSDQEISDREREALEQTYWPGRSQKISHCLPDGRVIDVLIDAAHTKGFYKIILSNLVTLYNTI